jgi:hypothetical protein
VYLDPIGAVLVVAALAAVHSTVRLARLLERRLAELRQIEARGSTGWAGMPLRASPPPGRSWNVPGLVAMVWATQCALYVLQENLESRAAHLGTPGLAVLGGAHAYAPLVHLTVAMVLVAGLWVGRRQVTRLVQVVRLAEVRLRFARRAGPTVSPGSPARVWTPIDRWGRQLWSRPPPVPRVA